MVLTGPTALRPPLGSEAGAAAGEPGGAETTSTPTLDPPGGVALRVELGEAVEALLRLHGVAELLVRHPELEQPLTTLAIL